MTDVLIVYYSLYGHVHRLAEAAAEGVRDGGAYPVLRRVPETLPPEVIEKMGATAFQREFAKVPVCTREELAAADAVIVGTPTRFGNMCGQMRQFFDATGGLWTRNALVGKIGSVFTSSGTQHGGQESTILATQITLLHHGMVLAGLPYAFAGQSRMDEITGCSPYGASTIAGGDRWPSENELAGAWWQGTYVALLAGRLASERENMLIRLLKKPMATHGKLK
ncbi:MAG: NAD(P)H:quinone oxidoreductase [Methanomicrobiales archaeon]|nr:NAD(P)H:quinone oxidoreductase [Methanomicrobiales archaeon]